jgi:hypothetical protein
MNRFCLGALLAATLAVAACEHKTAPPVAGSPGARAATAPESTKAPAVGSWDPSAGPLLLVATESPERAFVVVPDSASAGAALASIPHPASVTLFGRGGTVQTAELPAVTDASACIVATLNAAPPPRPWSVGFIGGVIAPLAVDSTGSFSHADSVSFAARMTRLASTLPNDSAGRFVGLSFVVQSLWRFNIANGPQAVVATLSRQINQEATPLQEHTLVIAERAPRDTSFAMVYSERSYGAEETIQTRDLLAATLVGTNRNPAIVLSRDFGTSTAFSLLERGDDKRWRSRWTSARRHC